MSGSEFRHELLRALMGALGASVAGAVTLVGCATEETRCFYWPETPERIGCGEGDVTCDHVGGPACPTRDEAEGRLFDCDEEGTVDRGPRRKGEECCYDVSFHEVQAECAEPGRPFRGAGMPIVALPERRDDWLAEVRCDVTGLSLAERNELGDFWTTLALAEHASVASFQELVLDLLANGAPPELISAAISAASDEVEHARLCFALATAFRGSPVGPGSLPVPRAKPKTLLELARRNAADACRNETLALLLLDEQRRRATDPTVRAVVERLIDDESTHAVLAFRIAAWAIEVGGAEVRRVTAEELALAPFVGNLTNDSDGLEGYGRLSRGAHARALELGYREVLRPALAALRTSPFKVVPNSARA